jgi:amidase
VTEDTLGALVPGWKPVPAPVGSGPLEGLSVVVKDVIDVEGSVTGGGNPDWAAAHQPAARSAPAVHTLAAAGVRLVAKGQCAELAFSLSGDNAHYGMPRNPTAPDCDPGGSTSGPASAVAGGICELGLGTDTLGSIRVPASYCGLHGFRPTHGRISVEGVMPLAQSFDTVGLLAADPDHLRRAAEVLLGEATGGARMPSRLLLSDAAFSMAEVDVEKAAQVAAENLAVRLSLELIETSLLDTAPPPADGMAAFNVLQGAQVWRNYGEWVKRTGPSLGPDIAARLGRAARVGPSDVAAAEPVAQAVASAVARLGSEEALVMPTTGTPAPARAANAEERERARLSAGQLTSIATLAGAPALSLPLIDLGGLPVGLSLIGPPGSDLSLLALASAARAGPS